MDSRFFIVFADILLPLLLGMALRQWGLSREILRMVIKANVVCVATFLSLVSFWSVHVTKELLWLPISIIPICFIPVLIFYGFQKDRFRNPLDQGSYMISMMLGNIGTLAGLCAYVLYGEKGFAYVQLIAVPQILVIVLFCFPMAQRFYEMGVQRTMETKGQALSSSFLRRTSFLPWEWPQVSCFPDFMWKDRRPWAHSLPSSFT